MNNFYVYSLIDPKDLSVYYIGKSKIDRRIERHFYPCNLNKSKYKYNPHKVNLIKKRKESGFEVENYFTQIAKNLSENKANELEKFLIREIGKENLTNLTDGGEGKAGFSHSQKTKDKISESLLGRSRSKELKEKISKAQKGRNLPKEQKDKIRKTSLENRDGNYKLTEEKVSEIKWLLQNTDYYHTEICKVYNVSNHTIGDISRGNTWTNISPQKPSSKIINKI
jgi:hypothetical protein